MEWCLVAVNFVRRDAGSWSNIEVLTWNSGTEEGTENPGWMVYDWVYAVLGINLYSWPLEIVRDHLTVWSMQMVVLWTTNSDGGGWWEYHGGYKQIRQIQGMAGLIGVWRGRISWIAFWIRHCICHIGNCQFTCMQHSLKFQCLIMISELFSAPSLPSSTLPPSDNLMLNCPTPSFHAEMQSQHWVRYSLCTAHTK